MKLQSKFVAVIALAFGAAPMAFADFQATFDINHDQPASAIYADLVSTAKSECKEAHPRWKYASGRFRIVRICSEDLMDKVVAKLNRNDITALHYGIEEPQILLASPSAESSLK